MASSSTAPSQRRHRAGAPRCVSGKVKEYFNQTQINADELVVTRPQGAIPAAVDLLPVAGESLSQLLERHEGMQVRLVPGSSLVVTRNFSFDYDGKRNNLVLAYGAPLIKSTQKFAAMSQEASDWALRNQQNQLVVETDAKAPGRCAALVPRLQRRGRVTCASATSSTGWRGRLVTPTTCSGWWPTIASTRAR